MAIMFGANNGWVYAVGIFIVATLVTELAFLEKLAAIAWNRKEYWQYLLEKASPKDIEDKRRKEVLEDQEAGEPSQSKARVQATERKAYLTQARSKLQSILLFEKDATEALRRDGQMLFGTSRVSDHVKLKGKTGNVVIDAVASAGDKHFVVEIKAYKHPKSVRHAASAVSEAATSYATFLLERNRSGILCPVLVLPSELSGFKPLSVPVLKFDSVSKQFTNIEEFQTAADLYMTGA